MARYSKTHSNYILKKRHQTLEDGSTIFERDWGTLGERHVIERGKRRIYSDSNFLFTDNMLSGKKYRNNTGEWSEPYSYDTLGDTIDKTVNDTSILSDSNDIRDYAYYGSAVELVRASVENIIKWFPGRFWGVDAYINRYINDAWYYVGNIVTDGHHNYVIEYKNDILDCEIYEVQNPFTIDFYTKDVVIGKYDNALRNMSLSFKQYTLNGYEINGWDAWGKTYSECDEDYTIKYDITITYDTNRVGHLYGISINNRVLWCTTIKDLMVQPKDTVINNYFKNLTGFEAKLLSKKYNPIYTAKFITPIPRGNNRPDYIYVERAYTWPSTGYCINVDSGDFQSYFESLYDLATKMDELWCDNLWRNMTHEAISNFDWTYTKEYNEGEEVDNILGGTRMEGILRIWGRTFDDIKRYIDGISIKNCVTYDAGTTNLANAELSDKAGLLGWEVYSTKLNQSDNLYLTNEFIDTYIGKLNQNERWGYYDKYRAGDIIDSGTVYYVYNETKHEYEPGQGLVLPYIVQEDDHYYKYVDATVSYKKWYDSMNPDAVSQNTVDNDFMNRLLLSTGEIFRSKGTKHSFEMVLGLFGIGNHDEEHPEIEFEEKYYTVVPRERDGVFCYYIQDLDPSDPSEYTDLTKDNITGKIYTALDEFLVDYPPYPGTQSQLIKIYINNYYELIQYKSFGEVCEDLVYYKSAVLNYEDDEFSGTPIKDVYINNTHYIVPYFSQDKIYDGYVYFESKGGWGKFINTGDDIDVAKHQAFDYLETIPYMETVQTVGALLTVNPFQIGDKRVFYVTDISDCTQYDENIPINLSHLFILKNPNNPNLFSSWKNIPSDGVIDLNYDIFSGVTQDDVRLAEYNDKLSFDNLGNNPHTGNGGYDMGTEYLEYLEMPFKNAIKNYGFSNIGDEVIAKQIKFKVTEHTGKDVDKISNNANTQEYTKYEPGSQISKGDFYYEKVYFTSDEFAYVEKVASSDIIVPEDNDQYYYIEYILPSKVLKIKNNIDNDYYKTYLKEVILKYLTQVIPSTTILYFENFEVAQPTPPPPIPPTPPEPPTPPATHKVSWDGDDGIFSITGMTNDVPISSGDEVEEGAIVKLTAKLKNGYKFSLWLSSDVNIESPSHNPCTFAMVDHDVLVKAKTEAVTVYYTVSWINGQNVTITGKANGTIDIVNGETLLPAGSSVVLTATPDTDYLFKNWTGNTPSGAIKDGNIMTFTLIQNESGISAVAEPVPVTKQHVVAYTWEGTVTNVSGVTNMGETVVSGNRYNEGTVITLTADIPSGDTLSWEPNDLGTFSGNSVTFTLTSDRTNIKAIGQRQTTTHFYHYESTTTNCFNNVQNFNRVENSDSVEIDNTTNNYTVLYVITETNTPPTIDVGGRGSLGLSFYAINDTQGDQTKIDIYTCFLVENGWIERSSNHTAGALDTHTGGNYVFVLIDTEDKLSGKTFTISINQN